jgi:thioredoxin reductase (NADPH)
MMNQQFDVVADVVVVGEGVAGLSVTLELAKKGLKVVNFEGHTFGGLVLTINQLEPHPFGDVSSGADFASNFLMEIMDLEVERYAEYVTSIEKLDASYLVISDSMQIQTQHVVIASGAKLKSLGIPGELEFEGRGVSHCADCDGAFFIGSEVVVVGGGDSAMQEALILAEYANKVIMLIRGHELSGSVSLRGKVLAKQNIEQCYQTTILEILGEVGVHSVLTQSLSDQSQKILTCQGVFPFIGLEANTQFLPREIQLNSQGQVVINDKLCSTLPNIWAIGAVRAGGNGLLSDAIEDAKRVCKNIISQ